jgi:chitin disaccharide deacetylase
MPTRRLIVNADDFGQSVGVTRGILAAHDGGIVTSTSLMVRWPAAVDAADAARSRPRLSVGLHVDLGEWTCRQGEWVPVYEVVPINDSGAVADEVARQLAAFRRLMGREPTHLDSHQHVHRREPVLSVLTAASRELNVPLRHFSPDVTYCGNFYGQDTDGSPLAEVLSVEGLIRILTALPAGRTELACHPADAHDLDTMYRAERLAELAILCDLRVREAVRCLGIELCSFHDVSSREG